jgi:hypothetical protein
MLVSATTVVLTTGLRLESAAEAVRSTDHVTIHSSGDEQDVERQKNATWMWQHSL